MAKIGFEYIVAGKLDTDVSVSKETLTYTEAREIGPGAKFTATPSTSDVKDYGDDRMLEMDVSETGGTLSLELNEPTLENEAWILGHTYTEDGGMLCNTEDIPPYVGVGTVGKSKSNGKILYWAKVYYKVYFKIPTDEHSTKQENVTFTHTTLEGTWSELENHDARWKQVYDTLEEAKAALNALFGITEETA